MGFFDMKSLNKLMRGNKGATAVEYGIIAALIAGVLIATVKTLGEDVNTEVGAISTTLGS